jgi:hypothetical protein
MLEEDTLCFSYLKICARITQAKFKSKNGEANGKRGVL